MLQKKFYSTNRNRLLFFRKYLLKYLLRLATGKGSALIIQSTCGTAQVGGHTAHTEMGTNPDSKYYLRTPINDFRFENMKRMHLKSSSIDVLPIRASK